MPSHDTKKFKCSWDEAREILRIVCWGDHDISDAQALGAAVEAIVQQHSDGLLVLDDLREAKSATREAMLYYAELLESPAVIRRAFLVQPKETAHVIADLLIKMSGSDNTRIFTDETAAIAYLQSA